MADEKNELTAQLALARARLSDSFGGVRRDVDVPAKLRHSYGNNKLFWIAGAAIAGVVLAKLPARKKKVFVEKNSGQKIAREAAGTGILLLALKFAFSAFRPAITSFVAKRTADWIGNRPR